MNDISLDDLKHEREQLVRMYEDLIKASNEFDGKMQSRYDTQKEEYAAQANMVGESIKNIDRQIAQILERRKGDFTNDIISIGSKVKISIDNEDPIDILIINDTGGRKVSGFQLISVTTPIGKNLIGKKVGDVIFTDAPGGKFSVSIIEILSG